MDYRETSISPLTDSISVCLLWSRCLLKSRAVNICSSFAKNRATDEELIQSVPYITPGLRRPLRSRAIRIYREHYLLPSEPGLGWEIIHDLWPNWPLMATTRPANYADNLMSDRTIATLLYAVPEVSDLATIRYTLFSLAGAHPDHSTLAARSSAAGRASV